MTIDHIGYIFFPDKIIFRIIGRLTMPIMTFFAAEGIRRTSNATKYLLRLFVFAVISEIPYRLAFNWVPKQDYYPSNVIFTIFLGVLAIVVANTITKKLKNPAYRLIPYAACIYLAQFFYTDWNWLGIVMIIAFYHAGQDKKRQFIYLAGSYIASILAELITAWLSGTLALGLWSPIHIWGIASILPIFFYNGKRGCPRPFKYFFYIFYPTHLIILYLIKIFR